MRRWIAVFAMLLAGCGTNEGSNKAVGNAAAPASAPVGPHLGDVDLTRPIRATDAALTWAMEIAPGAISLTRFAANGGDSDVTDFYPVAPRVAGGKAVYETKDESGTPATITLAADKCLEQGAPAIDRPLTLTLEIDGKLIKGCAGPRPADGLDEASPDNAAAINAR